MSQEGTWCSAPAERIRAAVGLSSPDGVSGARVQVPILDLSQKDAALTDQMRRACRECGFMYVTGHGVGEELLERQFKANAALFALPLEQKMALRADSSNRGYFPCGMGSAKNPYKQEDRKEAFNVYGFESDDTSKAFHGRNKWPADSLLPGYRETIEDYYAAMHRVALRVLKLLALALDLDPDFFAPLFTNPVANVRAVHYFGDPSNPAQGIFGVGAHTDWGMLTILATDEVPGLQIHLEEQWIDMPPRPGYFVVNLGDLVHRFTDGYFRSTLHRVCTGRERYSTPFFLAPNWDAVVDILPQCRTRGEPFPPPTTCGEWLSMRRDAEYGGGTVKAL